MELGLRLLRPESLLALNSATFTRPSTLPGQRTELIPGAENPHFTGGLVRVNAEGLRGPPTPPDQPGDLRILAIGDSVTFGYGVPEEAAFHQVLARRWAEDHGRPVVALNAGLPSAGLPYALHALRRRCLATAPDLVLVNIVLNDISWYPPEATLDQPLPGASAERPWLDRLVDRSYAASKALALTKGGLYRLGVLNLADNPGYRFLPLAPPSPEVDRAWADSLRVLDALVDEGRRCGVPLVLTVFPVEVQLSPAALARYREGIGLELVADATDLAPQRRLADWALSRDAPLLDLSPAFQQDPVEALFLRDLNVNLDPVHPSELGHRRVGEWLAEALPARGLVALRP